MRNFNRPYFSRSIGEFWRRWHISLMSWFRDYVYISLGGSRVPKWKWIRNIITVFLISGLWHGANVTFIIWGLLNGLYILLTKWTEGVRGYVAKRLPSYSESSLQAGVQIVGTFLLVNVAWVFFRAESLSDAFFIVRRIAEDIGTMAFELIDITTLSSVVGSLGLSRYSFFGLMVAILVVFVVHIFEERGKGAPYFERLPAWVRWTSYYALILFIVFFGFTGTQAFIYFQF